MPKKKRTPGRDRRLRQRLFAAGNTMCPICLRAFSRADVVAGTEVALEHAPPKSLGGSVTCLTCERCNNEVSLVDHHAYLSKKARDEWSAGKGAPIVVDLFGHKKTYRFIPQVVIKGDVATLPWNNTSVPLAVGFEYRQDTRFRGSGSQSAVRRWPGVTGTVCRGGFED